MIYIFGVQLMDRAFELTDALSGSTDEKINLFKKCIFCKFIRVKRDRQENP